MVHSFAVCFYFILLGMSLNDITVTIYSEGEKKAPTISTEEEFERSKAAILKKSGQCDIGVQFDLDTMEGFHNRKRVSTCFVELFSFLFIFPCSLLL